MINIDVNEIWCLGCERLFSIRDNETIKENKHIVEHGLSNRVILIKRKIAKCSHCGYKIYVSYERIGYEMIDLTFNEDIEILNKYHSGKYELLNYRDAIYFSYVLKRHKSDLIYEYLSEFPKRFAMNVNKLIKEYPIKDHRRFISGEL